MKKLKILIFFIIFINAGCSDKSTDSELENNSSSSSANKQEEIVNTGSEENNTIGEALDSVNDAMGNMSEEYKQALSDARNNEVKTLDEFRDQQISLCETNPLFTMTITDNSKLSNFCGKLTDCSIREMEKAFSGIENISRSDPEYFDKMSTLTGKCMDEVDMSKYK